jgi:hypothetical protein
MSAYFVVELEITDPQAMEPYRAAGGATRPLPRAGRRHRKVGHGHIFCLRARARGKSQQIRQFCAGGDFVNYTNPLILLDT